MSFHRRLRAIVAFAGICAACGDGTTQTDAGACRTLATEQLSTVTYVEWDTAAREFFTDGRDYPLHRNAAVTAQGVVPSGAGFFETKLELDPSDVPDSVIGKLYTTFSRPWTLADLVGVTLGLTHWKGQVDCHIPDGWPATRAFVALRDESGGLLALLVFKQPIGADGVGFELPGAPELVSLSATDRACAGSTARDGRRPVLLAYELDDGTRFTAVVGDEKTVAYRGRDYTLRVHEGYLPLGVAKCGELGWALVRSDLLVAR